MTCGLILTILAIISESDRFTAFLAHRIKYVESGFPLNMSFTFGNGHN